MALSVAELELEVREGWELVAEHDLDCDDPDVEMLAWAWSRIAWASAELGRFEDTIEAADGLGALSARVGDLVADQWLAMALRRKRDALVSLGREAEADAVDIESISRFQNSIDPEAREQAAVALSYHSHSLLSSEKRFAEGLVLTAQLVDLLDAEPDESVLGIAEVTVLHMHLLIQAYGEGVIGASWMAIGMLWSHARAASGSAWSSLRRFVPARLHALSRLSELADRLTPAALERASMRAAAAIVLGRAIAQRLALIDDDQTAPLLARIEVYSNYANLILGQPGAHEAMRATNARRDPDIAAAYQHLVDMQSSSPAGFVEQVGILATLRLRADALIGDDPASARFAFEDSLAKALPASVSRPIRWLASYLSRWP